VDPRVRPTFVATAAVLIALFVVSVPIGTAGAVAAHPGALPSSSTLSANVTYLDLGGDWNCGQGHQTFEFFGNVAGGEAPYTYNWTFGDGTNGSQIASPSHTFSRIGQFVVNVSIRDSAGTFLNASISPVWGISDVCTGASELGPLGAFGVALYAALILAIVLGAFLAIRVRRRRPPPELAADDPSDLQ
jgi:hypothetical protein